MQSRRTGWSKAPLLLSTAALAAVMVFHAGMSRSLQSLEQRVARSERSMRSEISKFAHRLEVVEKQRFSENSPETRPPTPRPPQKKQRRESAVSGSRGVTANSTEMLREHFGLLSKDEYEAKRNQHSKWLVSTKYFAHLDDPSRFDLLASTEWHSDGTLVTPKKQSQPTWPKKTDPRYFEKYVYRLPHRCPGQPYECSGRGVCDYSRGVCVCHPPWTGWQCTVKMIIPSSLEPVQSFEDKHCADQIISSPDAEKWDARTETRCRNISNANGMWLGLTKGMSQIIARSIAGAMGVTTGKTVLDIGMGCGTLTDYINQDIPGLHLSGFDYSAAAIRYVRERHEGTFCTADVRKLDFLPTNSIDFAFENGVFSVTRQGHCTTYKEIVRALKPGGTFLVYQTHTDWHPVKCWQNIRMQSIEGCLGRLRRGRGATPKKYQHHLDSVLSTYSQGISVTMPTTATVQARRTQH